jgi:hypothetical protein
MILIVQIICIMAGGTRSSSNFSSLLRILIPWDLLLAASFVFEFATGHASPKARGPSPQRRDCPRAILFRFPRSPSDTVRWSSGPPKTPLEALDRSFRTPPLPLLHRSPRPTAVDHRDFEHRDVLVSALIASRSSLPSEFVPQMPPPVLGRGGLPSFWGRRSRTIHSVVSGASQGASVPALHPDPNMGDFRPDSLPLSDVTTGGITGENRQKHPKAGMFKWSRRIAGPFARAQTRAVVRAGREGETG